MCMEDVKIGRNLSSQMKTITIDNVSRPLFSSGNASRFSFTLSLANPVPISIAPAGYDHDINNGLMISPEQFPYTITFDAVGSLMRQAWNILTTGGGDFLTVVENILDARKSSELKDL